MAIEPEIHHPDTNGPDADVPDGLDAVLDAVRRQLAAAVDQATRKSRREVEASAAAVAVREVAAATLERSVADARESLQVERINLTERLAAAGERERVAEADQTEARQLKERAVSALADALERTAHLAEEAEAKARADEAAAKEMIEVELRDARARADELTEQASRRLEAARIESAAVLERAVERGVRIVAEAEAEAERTRAGLRELASRIDEFLHWHADAGDEAGVALGIDLREEVAGADGDAAATTDCGDAAPEEGDVVDLTEAAEDDDGRVVDAVRRAMRGWVGNRREIE